MSEENFKDRHALAIIIPAYKPYFLAQTLLSLSKQTDKNFTIYIGDDCSPYDLQSIISPFSRQINIVYHRFDNNMGSTSLTKQWERCVALSKEEWVWLFADDDIASSDAVESFYQKVKVANLLYKFNTRIIDEKGDSLLRAERHDRMNLLNGELSSKTYIHNRLESKGFRSYAVEYIFHRSLYESYGFVDFPLAWSSDDATWLLYSLHNSKKIEIIDTFIYWRSSGKNISSNNKDIENVKQKIKASQLYIKWLIQINLLYQLDISKGLTLRWLTCQIFTLNPSIKWSTYRSIFNIFNSYFSVPLLFKYYMLCIKSKQVEAIVKRRLRG